MPSPPKGPPPGSFGLKVMNRFTALNVFLYRRTGGRIGGTIGNIKPLALVDHCRGEEWNEADDAFGLVRATVTTRSSSAPRVDRRRPLPGSSTSAREPPHNGSDQQ
jgi:hypothetical protein